MFAKKKQMERKIYLHLKKKQSWRSKEEANRRNALEQQKLLINIEKVKKIRLKDKIKTEMTIYKNISGWRKIS